MNRVLRPSAGHGTRYRRHVWRGHPSCGHSPRLAHALPGALWRVRLLAAAAAPRRRTAAGTRGRPTTGTAPASRPLRGRRPAPPGRRSACRVRAWLRQGSLRALLSEPPRAAVRADGGASSSFGRSLSTRASRCAAISSTCWRCWRSGGWSVGAAGLAGSRDRLAGLLQSRDRRALLGCRAHALPGLAQVAAQSHQSADARRCSRRCS